MGGRHTKLTAQQEGFAYSHVMEKMNQSSAYRKHYKTKNMSDGTIYTEASLLASHPKVSKRINELKEELRKSLEVTREGQVDEYRKLLEEARLLLNEEGQTTSQSVDLRIKTLARIDKICGLESSNLNVKTDHEDWLDSLK